MWGQRSKIVAIILGVVASAATSVMAAETYGPTRAGDGAYSIAAQLRQSGSELTITDWVNALYKLNPQAFDGSPSALKTGVTLSIPNLNQVRRFAGLQDQAEPEDESGGTRSALFYAERETPIPAPVLPEPLQVTPVSSATDEQDVPVDRAEQSRPTPPPAPEDSVEVAVMVELSSGDSASQGPIKPFIDSALYRRAIETVGSASTQKLLQSMLEQEALYAGDADYDYLLGVLLMDNGQAEQAIFPLQRAVQTSPENFGFKIDLARAYFETNDNASAQLLFETLASSAPPPAAAEVIDSYLSAIKRRSKQYESSWVHKLTLRSGHDSNVNAATDLRRFVGFDLAEASRSQESAFVELRLATQYAKPIAPRWHWLSKLGVAYRDNPQASDLNTSLIGLSTGFGYRRGEWDLSVLANADQLRIDGQENASRAALTGAWAWNLNQFTRVLSSLRLGSTRYLDALSARDTDNVIASIGINQRSNWFLGSEFGLDILLGEDDARETGSPYGRAMFGLLASSRLQFTPRMRLNAGLQALASDYDGDFFGRARDDDLLAANLELELTDQRFEDWQLALQLMHQANQSSVGLFDYNRSAASLALSYTFD